MSGSQKGAELDIFEAIRDNGSETSDEPRNDRREEACREKSGSAPNLPNLPTLLTVVRIILTPPVIICILIDSTAAHIAALICFLLAALTDFIDGRLARQRHQVTTLGAFLDPLADKMLVNLTFLALVQLQLVPLWIFVVILVRDFAVDGLRMLAANQGIALAAHKSGKLKTMVQMFTLSLLLLNLILSSNVLTTFTTILLYIVVTLTLYSGAHYFYHGRHYFASN